MEALTAIDPTPGLHKKFASSSAIPTSGGYCMRTPITLPYPLKSVVLSKLAGTALLPF